MKMKKKVIISMLAVTATLALGAFMGGCSLSDKIEQWRCDHENITENVVIDPTCYEKGELKKTCDDCGKTWTEDIEKVAHTWNDGEVVVEATCTETGITRYTCTVEGCEAVEDRITDKLEHTRVEMPAVAPTCTTAGYTEWSKCDDCGLVLVKKQELPALGHVETELKAVAPTCTETGLTAGVACLRCDEVITAQTVIPATGHNIVTVAGKPATCTETGLTDGQACGDCGKVYVEHAILPVLGHSYDDGVVMTAATCTDVGVMTYTCENCLGTKSENIPALGHDYVDKLCSRCGSEQASPYTYYSETAVENGTPVAEKVYRFYKRAKTDNDYANMIIIKDSFSLFDSAGNVVNLNSLFFGVNFDSTQTESAQFVIGTEPMLGSCAVIADITTSIEYYETDEYIDVVLKVGDTFALEEVFFNTDRVSGTITISSNATVGILGTPYCLVASEE